MKIFFVTTLALLVIAVSCKKDKDTPAPAPLTPVPFLTGKKWTADTITINAPATYNQLNANEQFDYRAGLQWWGKKALLTFNENGTVTSGGDWDMGYNFWKLINNNTDIEILISNGRKDTLFNWTANNQQFTYRKVMPSYNSTFIYK
jgi:hypothetical protein